jgi:hypothetical protein
MSCKIVDYCCEDDRLHCWVEAHKKMLNFIIITQFWKNRVGESRLTKDNFYKELVDYCKEHSYDIISRDEFYEELGRVVLWKEYREFDAHPFSNERSWHIYLPTPTVPDDTQIEK